MPPFKILLSTNKIFYNRKQPVTRFSGDAFVVEPEFRSQCFNRLKRILKRVGIPGVLSRWYLKTQKGGIPTQ
jgi:hypothetical protein